MNVIAHHAIRQHPTTRKVFVHPHVNAKLLFLFLPESKLPVHHSRDAVIDNRTFKRILPRGQPACFSHEFDDFEVERDKKREREREPAEAGRDFTSSEQMSRRNLIIFLTLNVTLNVTVFHFCSARYRKFKIYFKIPLSSPNKPPPAASGIGPPGPKAGRRPPNYFSDALFDALFDF